MKYIWKCENCGHEFEAENPSQCTKCGHDDILILRETSPKTPWKWILITTVGIFATVLVVLNWGDLFDSGEKPTSDGEVTTYFYKIIRYDNYFEIDGNGIDDVGLFVINLNGDKLYSDGNEFYPCEDGDFIIKWDEERNIKLDGDKLVKNFKITTEAHKNACKLQLDIVDIYYRDNECIFTIMTNMDDNPNLEVSLNRNNGYQMRKLIWNKSELNEASYFYVRLKGSDNYVKRRIPVCKINPPSKGPEPSQVVSSFNKFTNDINNNRKQFTDLLKNSNPIIVYKGNEMEKMAFIMQIRTEVKNEGDDFLASLKLTENNVFYDSDSTIITKLIITQ